LTRFSSGSGATKDLVSGATGPDEKLTVKLYFYFTSTGNDFPDNLKNKEKISHSVE
jgi:hypothetical protein